MAGPKYISREIVRGENLLHWHTATEVTSERSACPETLHFSSALVLRLKSALHYSTCPSGSMSTALAVRFGSESGYSVWHSAPRSKVRFKGPLLVSVAQPRMTPSNHACIIHSFIHSHPSFLTDRSLSFEHAQTACQCGAKRCK